MTTAPTLVPSAWIDDDMVVIHDRLNHSPGRIPLDLIHEAWTCANQRDDERATVHGRSYHRDVLLMARELVDALPSCACGDPWATRDMGDGNRLCPSCCSAAQGTHYDDKDDIA